MAYEVKYRSEFTDINGADWKVDIEADGYAGDVITMQHTGDPLNIDFLTLSDDLHSSPVKGSMVTLNVECDTNFTYIDLYSYADMVFKMKVYIDGDLFWWGWLSSDYNEPYDTPPYTVSLTAADGLGLLKDIEFKDDGEYYSGRDYEHNIILEILAKIGHTQFTEFCNIYEDNFNEATDDSPMEQLSIDQTVFRDLSCYEVMEEILKKYSAVIRQCDGEFIIYRPVEFIGDTVYGRTITTATVTGTSMTPDQYLRTDSLIDTNGGVLMFHQPYSQFTPQQDYGSKDSWIENYNFDISTWNDDDDTFNDWIGGGGQPISFDSDLSKETEGIEIMPDGTGHNYYYYQSFGSQAQICSDVFAFSFDYLYVNRNAVKQDGVSFGIALGDDASTYFLNDVSEAVAEFQSGYHHLNVVNDVPAGVGSWQTAYYTISGLPVNGPLQVVLHATDNSYVRVAYKGLRFYATSDQLSTITKDMSSYIKWWLWLPPFTIPSVINSFSNSPLHKTISEYTDNEEIVLREYPSPVVPVIDAPTASQRNILGDVTDVGITNVIEQFRGALAYYKTGSLVQTATDFVTDYSADYAALTNPSVLLTSVGDTLYFESDTPGVNFTGATTITNATGNLTGTRYEVVANNAGTKQKETLTFTAGSAGEFVIISFITSGTGTWDTDMETTLDNFVSDYAAAFALGNVALTNTATTLIFEEVVIGGGFSCPVFKPGVSDFAATWATTTPGQVASVAPVARIDKIVLLGTSGTATVVCHAETNTATFNTGTVLEKTETWHTRGNTEGLQLLQVISDEMADMHSQGRQFIQLPIIENTAAIAFTMIGNLQDPINIDGTDSRVFIPNRANFDVRNRQWTVDLIEIGTK